MSKRPQHLVQRVTYILILVILSFYLISPFIIPIVLAGTIALVLFPFQLKLEQLNWTRNRAAAFITFIFTMVISLPFLFFLTKGTIVVIDFLEEFSVGEKIQNQGMQKIFSVLKHDMIERLQTFLARWPSTNFLTEEKIMSYLKGVNEYILDFFRTTASNLPAIALFLLMMVLFTYSFLSGAASVRKFFQELFGFTNRKMDLLVEIFLRDARQVYISNVVTGTFQSILVATGVYFVSNADWFLVFFVTLILSFIPVIGAAPMAFFFALVAFVQGNSSGAIGLSVLAVFTGLIDNILRPWLASYGETKAPAIISFVFVIGGALLLGISGLFIGLFVAAIAYDTLPIFWEDMPEFLYFKDISKEETEITHI
jgi:predicted PurR-regulated permease PerM